MKFPYSEAEVVVLAEAMIAGYSAHAADFPSVDQLSLGTSLTDYKTARDSQEDARAQAQLATEAKNEKLGELVEITMEVEEHFDISVPDEVMEETWKMPSEP